MRATAAEYVRTFTLPDGFGDAGVLGIADVDPAAPWFGPVEPWSNEEPRLYDAYVHRLVVGDARRIADSVRPAPGERSPGRCALGRAHRRAPRVLRRTSRRHAAAWPSQALEAAAHTVDLLPDDRVWLTLDVAQHALGTAACGPLPQDKYVLSARPFHRGVTFSRLS